MLIYASLRDLLDFILEDDVVDVVSIVKRVSLIILTL